MQAAGIKAIVCEAANNQQRKRGINMNMKRNGFKKRIAVMMTVSALLSWFALPNVAHARTVTIEGRNIYTSITASVSSATATISYTEGPGQVRACVIGNARSILAPNVTMTVSGPKNSNPTPGGVSSSVNAPDGWKFYGAYSECSYEVNIIGKTYAGGISDNIDL